MYTEDDSYTENIEELCDDDHSTRWYPDLCLESLNVHIYDLMSEIHGIQKMEEIQ